MHLDPHFQEISLVLFVLLIFGMISRQLKLPSAIGFLIAGVCLGPSFLAVVKGNSAITQIGSAGVVLLLFSVGMEISIKDVLKEWKVTIIGTVLQIALSVGFVFILGNYFDWPIARSILLGFVISLSSSAMVIKLLKDKSLSGTALGRDTLGILVAQDILVVPMLIIIGFLGESKVDSSQVSKQLIGSVGIFLLLYVTNRVKISRFKFIEFIKQDNELTLLFCLSFAFGLALLSGLAELSTALGAFIAGGIIYQLKLSDIFHHSVLPFQVVMTAIFFSSIGLLLDMSFFKLNYPAILILTFMALFTNTVINCIILKISGRKLSDSLEASSYLAQIGEFSFILAALGLQQGVINDYSYQMTIFIIFLSILLTPLWIKSIAIFVSKFLRGK